MDLYEKIKLLTSEKKMSIRQLEETLGFGNGVINRWRKNTPGSDKLKKVADYFDVSIDYLLGRTEDPAIKEEKEDDLDEVLDRMMSFDGQPMTDLDREAIRAYLQGRLGKK